MPNQPENVTIFAGIAVTLVCYILIIFSIILCYGEKKNPGPPQTFGEVNAPMHFDQQQQKQSSMRQQQMKSNRTPSGRSDSRAHEGSQQCHSTSPPLPPAHPPPTFQGQNPQTRPSESQRHRKYTNQPLGQPLSPPPIGPHQTGYPPPPRPRQHPPRPPPPPGPYQVGRVPSAPPPSLPLSGQPQPGRPPTPPPSPPFTGYASQQRIPQSLPQRGGQPPPPPPTPGQCDPYGQPPQPYGQPDPYVQPQPFRQPQAYGQPQPSVQPQPYGQPHPYGQPLPFGGVFQDEFGYL